MRAITQFKREGKSVAVATTVCKQPPKVVTAIVDPHKCEGAGDCARVCPHQVFEIRKLTKGELKALPLIPWLKVLAHGGSQAFVANPSDCHACGLCVAACPEKAIRLTRLEQSE
jgi:NAD-dependent dihydropyrimidine dehydrogenase PreA subunit